MECIELKSILSDDGFGGDTELTVLLDPLANGVFAIETSFLEQEDIEEVKSPFGDYTLTLPT